MVAHSGAPLRPHQFRPLNRPSPIEVLCDAAGLPLFVNVGKRRRRVVAILDRWRIDEEWWREPISRLYYEVECEDGTRETIYCDLLQNTWYRQRDSRVR